MITQLSTDHYSISKLKYKNLNSFSKLLALLSGNNSLNPGPFHQDTLHIYAAVKGISESKLDTSMLQQEISIDNYKILCCDRNRNGVGVACYVRNDSTYFRVKLKILF